MALDKTYSMINWVKLSQKRKMKIVADMKGEEEPHRTPDQTQGNRNIIKRIYPKMLVRAIKIDLVPMTLN